MHYNHIGILFFPPPLFFHAQFNFCNAMYSVAGFRAKVAAGLRDLLYIVKGVISFPFKELDATLRYDSFSSSLKAATHTFFLSRLLQSTCEDLRKTNSSRF